MGKSLELLTSQIHFCFNFFAAVSLACEAHKTDRMCHLQFSRRKSMGTFRREKKFLLWGRRILSKQKAGNIAKLKFCFKLFLFLNAFF